MPEFNQTSPDFASAPLQPPSDDYVPQFSSVQYAQPAALESCANCSTVLSSQYYVITGKKLCPECTKQALNSGKTVDDHAAFVRAILFGICGAVVGMILYAAVTITLKATIGYFALGVGWIVGRAMMQGSGNRGGRHYQIAAAAFTYAAISLAPILEVLYHIYDRHVAIANWGAESQRLLFIGIASPFLEFQSNPGWAAIGLIILFVGIRIAWRMTRARQLPVAGPYKVGAA